MVSQHHPYRTLFVSCTASTYTLTASPSALRLALEITRERGDMNIAQDNQQPCLLQTRASAATPQSLCRRRVRMGRAQGHGVALAGIDAPQGQGTCVAPRRGASAPVSVVNRISGAQERREEREERKQQRPPRRMAVDHTPQGRRHRLQRSTCLYHARWLTSETGSPPDAVHAASPH